MAVTFAAPATERKVLVVGVGGLGCPASLALARAGVGRITLADPDLVDPTNLHRQLWHRSADLGQPKVRSAADKLAAAFPKTQVHPLQQRVDARCADALFAAHDLVIDATDGAEAKFMLSDASVRTGVPLVHGGVLRMSGLAMVIAPGGPCLRCLFETPPGPDEAPTCAQAGVLGSMAGVVGALQAVLALGWLHGAERPSGCSTLHVFDGAELRGRTLRVLKAADCPACGPGPALPREHR
jgi:molybdopterin-synthase adenylyltransferase